jgi:hypothetical protein
MILKKGTRKQVMNGKALKTGGGLKKKDLKYNKYGKIVSIKLSNNAKKKYKKIIGGSKVDESKVTKAELNGIKGQIKGMLTVLRPLVKQKQLIKNSALNTEIKGLTLPNKLENLPDLRTKINDILSKKSKLKNNENVVSILTTVLALIKKLTEKKTELNKKQTNERISQEAEKKALNIRTRQTRQSGQSGQTRRTRQTRQTGYTGYTGQTDYTGQYGQTGYTGQYGQTGYTGQYGQYGY